ncbi:MAG: pyruvate kinase [Promethearchaeota archaeon]|jgi:pyruvate kinase
MAQQSFIKSKIVCTIGPSSRDPPILGAMREAGMDVARLNLSHGKLKEHKRITRHLREINEVAVLIDLPGPKIRLGDFKEPVILKRGKKVHFTTKNILGYPNELPVNYPKLPAEINIGEHIYINDGLIDILVTSIDKDLNGFSGQVLTEGEISNRKGINVPGGSLSIRSPTKQDIKGIKLGVEVDCDWIAASFIRSKDDVKRVRETIQDEGGDQPIISKIEHSDAIENIKEIVFESDGIMVARGDLGIEVPPWEVPLLQKKIIQECRLQGKPVIVATQMLESMVLNPRPTRAEASDIANALIDGADAVMLSAETAIGLFPVEAVRVMNRIGLAIEGKVFDRMLEQPKKGLPIPDLIGDLASRAVEAVEPSAIIVVTRSGFSALMVSKYRPRSKILAVCKDFRIARRMRIYWGVEPLDVEWIEDRDQQIVQAVKRSILKGLVNMDDVVMIVSGSTLIPPGQTTTLEVLKVREIVEGKD